MPVALGFRDSLRWIIDVGPTAGLDRLTVLLVSVAVATFALVLVAESVARLHEVAPA